MTPSCSFCSSRSGAGSKKKSVALSPAEAMVGGDKIMSLFGSFWRERERGYRLC